MKKKILFVVAAAMIALVSGITYGSVANQDDNCFSVNLEALADVESNSGSECHPIVPTGGVLVINGIICLNHEHPYPCSAPHSAYASSGTVDCVW